MMKIARRSRGLNQSELASLLGVTQATVSRLEGDLLTPTDEQLEALSEALQYPVDFFGQAERLYGLGPSVVYHRKRKSLSSGMWDQIEAIANIWLLHLDQLLEAAQIEESRFTRFDLDEFDGDPEEVARAARAAFFVPRGPVKNMTRVIEDAGGIIIQTAFGTRKLDAFNMWPPGGIPVIFVNPDLPGDRLRFTLAHELGHLLLHEFPYENMEEEADRFASEFLAPAAEIKPMFNKVNLEELARLKRYWKISMAAILMRAKHVGAVNERQARQRWMELGKAGYRSQEPAELDIPTERPSLLQELIDLYRQEMQFSVEEMSKLLKLFPTEYKQRFEPDGTGLRLVV